MKRLAIIDYNKLISWLLPWQLRTLFATAWLRVQLSQVVRLYQLWRRQREANLYGLAITPQVCYLQKVLNDRWDVAERRIFIEDSTDETAVFIYQDAELQPLYVYQDAEGQPVYVYQDGEVGQVLEDFIVWVDAAIAFDETQMRAVIDQYKLAGKKYRIQTF